MPGFEIAWYPPIANGGDGMFRVTIRGGTPHSTHLFWIRSVAAAGGPRPLTMSTAVERIVIDAGSDTCAVRPARTHHFAP